MRLVHKHSGFGVPGGYHDIAINRATSSSDALSGKIMNLVHMLAIAPKELKEASLNRLKLLMVAVTWALDPFRKLTRKLAGSCR